MAVLKAFLGWAPKLLAPPPTPAPGVEWIASASPCIAKTAEGYWSDPTRNSALLYDTRKEALTVDGANALTLLGFWALGVRFDADGPHEVAATQIFGDTSAAEAPGPHDRRLGFDVVQFDAMGFGCAPLSCNGLYPGRAVNRYGLFEDEEAAREFGEHVGRVGLYEPPPFHLVEVWGDLAE